MLAFVLDEAMAVLMQVDALRSAKPRLPKGERWATEDDYEPLPDGPVEVAFPEFADGR